MLVVGGGFGLACGRSRAARLKPPKWRRSVELASYGWRGLRIVTSRNALSGGRWRRLSPRPRHGSAELLGADRGCRVVAIGKRLHPGDPRRLADAEVSQSARLALSDSPIRLLSLSAGCDYAGRHVLCSASCNAVFRPEFPPITTAALAIRCCDALHRVRLALARQSVTDLGSKHRARATAFGEPDLSGSKITGSGLVQLGSLKSLERLSLAKTELSGDSLRYLAACSQSRALDLSGTPSTDAMAAPLANIAATWRPR